MHELLTNWFANGTFQAIYLALLVLLLVVPMLWLSRWYHTTIGRTEGGRRLQQRQRRSPDDLGDAIDAARDLARGAYGADAAHRQRRVYRFVAVWLLALAGFGGLAICYLPAA
jgi:hypothetical protein